MKTILETLYALGKENPWIASLTVAGGMVTVAVVCVLGCMVAGQIKERIQKEG
jgi:hypothetical protein